MTECMMCMSYVIIMSVYSVQLYIHVHVYPFFTIEIIATGLMHQCLPLL